MREGGMRERGMRGRTPAAIVCIPSCLKENRSCCGVAVPSLSHRTTLGRSKKMTFSWISSVTSMGGKALSGSGSSVISGGYVNLWSPSWRIFQK